MRVAIQIASWATPGSRELLQVRATDGNTYWIWANKDLTPAPDTSWLPKPGSLVVLENIGSNDDYIIVEENL